MFWDQAVSDTLLDQWKHVTPKYTVLETVHDRIYKQTWHKLAANRTMKLLISRMPNRGANWDLITENDGTQFYWVTDKTLTLLAIQGAVKE